MFVILITEILNRDKQMKVFKFNLTYSVALFQIFLLYFGCAAPDRITRPSSENEGIKNFEMMREDFDPAALNDDDIQIEDTDVTYSSYDDVLANASETEMDSLVTGYRIQLIQTTDHEEAKNAERDAIIRFDDDVYRVFDPPFYKVRVGDYVNWFDAQKIQKLAIQKGYREAWVIRTKVNLKKVRQWLDDF